MIQLEGRAEVVLRDVTQFYGDLSSKRRSLPEFRATDLEHRFGQLDPLDEPAVFGQGEGYPTGTATELENTGVGARNARNRDVELFVWCTRVRITTAMRIASSRYPAS